MSARLNLSIGIGTLAVMLVMSFGVLYFTNQGVKQSESNNKDIEELETKFNAFVDKWTERIRIGNNNTNNTQNLILNGVEEIKTEIHKGFGNLTAHRQVTNATFGEIQKILNTTTALTSNEYNEQAENKVHSIIGNMTKEHEIIFKALNITTKDNNTDAEDAIAILRNQIEQLENRTSQE